MLTPIMPAQRLLPVSIGILALGMAIALLYYGRVFFITVIIASIIAFLLDPVVELFMKMRLPRGVASFVVCSIGLMFVYLAGLGLYPEGTHMASALPASGARVNEWVDSVATHVDNFEKRVYQIGRRESPRC